MSRKNRTAPRDDLSFEQVDAILSYNPELGTFNWRVSRGSAKSGSETGCINNAGYVVIGLYGRTYLAHRLAFLLQTGGWPLGDIDHADGNRANNKWKNLRACSRSENLQNTKRSSRNTSGHKGVSWDKSRGKWRATIRIDARNIDLGRFPSASAAAEAYKIAANNRNIEFART